MKHLFSVSTKPAAGQSIVVSIHASAKEATTHLFGTFLSDAVSIHASAKEATQRAERRRPPLAVSIHASAKEATCGS